MSLEDQIDEGALQDVLEEGQELLREGMSLGDIELELSVVRKHSSFVVEAVMSLLWREAARRGLLGYIAWLKATLAAPLRGGVLVVLLVLITIPFTFIAVVLGFGLFPPGRYPKIVLMAPGIIAGALFFCVGGSLVYLLKRVTGGFRRQERAWRRPSSPPAHHPDAGAQSARARA